MDVVFCILWVCSGVPMCVGGKRGGGGDGGKTRNRNADGKGYANLPGDLKLPSQ